MNKLCKLKLLKMGMVYPQNVNSCVKRIDLSGNKTNKKNKTKFSFSGEIKNDLSGSMK